MDRPSNGKIDLSLLEPVFEKYGGQAGALIPILQQAQEVYGHLPRAALERIAQRLRVSFTKVYSVATFYSQFYLRRRGRHVLKLCDGTACHVKGSVALRGAIEQQFGILPGETTPDGALTLETVYCLGSCALAPVAVLDNQVMGMMRPDLLVNVVKQRLEATPEGDCVPLERSREDRSEDPPRLESAAQLEQLRERARNDLALRRKTGTRIIIGMATCGIASGAEATRDAILEELRKHQIEAEVTSVGCVGICSREPLVDIERAGYPRVTYCNVKPEMVPRLIEEHLVKGQVIEEWVLGRLSAEGIG